MDKQVLSRVRELSLAKVAKVFADDPAGEPQPQPEPTAPVVEPNSYQDYARRMGLAQYEPNVQGRIGGQVAGGMIRGEEGANAAFGPITKLLRDARKHYTPQDYTTRNKAFSEETGIPAEYAAGKMHEKLTEAVREVETGTPGTSDAPGAVGWKDWLTTNWQTLLPVGGLISYAFGGNVGKALGVMAMAAGGYNLYERYQRLSNPDHKYNAPIMAAIHAAANQQGPNGKPAPFSDLDAVAATVAGQYGDPSLKQVVKSGLVDYGFLASHGFKEHMMNQARMVPNQVLRDWFGRQTAGRVAGPAPAPTENVASTVLNQLQGWGSQARGWGGQGWNTAKGWLAPEAQPR